MEHRIVKKVRTLISLILVVAMLMPSLALAAPGTLVLPAMVTAIEEQAFQGDTSIRNVEIPEGTLSIGAEAFEGCSALETVIIPDSVESIGENAFANCANVVIYCSQDSYAAEYAAANGLAVQHPMAELNAVFEQLIDTVFIGYPNGYMIGAAEVEGYDEEQHGEVTWTLKCLDDEEAAPVHMFIVDDGPVAYVRFTDLGDAEGEVSYELSVSCSGYSAAETFTLNVTGAPDGLPTDIVYTGPTHFEQGDTFVLDQSCVEFVDGDFAVGGENMRFVLPGLTSMPVWTENESAWNGNSYYAGATFTFTQENGRYAVPICMILGNVEYYQEIVITLGNGIPANAEIQAGGESYEIYLGDGEDAEYWMDGFWLEGYPYDLELEGEWSLEIVETACEQPLMDVRVQPGDDYRWAELVGSNLTGETGTDLYRLTLKLGESIYTCDYAVVVSELPEGLPTALTGIESEVSLAIGESYEIRYTDFNPADGTLPEGARIGKHFGNVWETLVDVEGFEWLADEEGNEIGFRFTPVADGRYVFDANYMINNYRLWQTIVINAGSGISEDAGLWIERNADTFYLTDEEPDELWLGAIVLDGYPVLEGQQITWEIELLESSNETSVMDVRMGDGWEDTVCMLFCDGLSGETGEVTYRLTCAVDGVEFICDFDIYVEEMPEDLPTDGDLNVPETDYVFELGDTLEFNYSDVTIDNLPEGMDYHVSIDGMSDPWPLEQMEGFEWTEDGFKVTLTEEGAYCFRVNADLALNYGISEVVRVTVGEDVLAGAELSSGMSTEQIVYMADEIQTDDLWLNNAFITGVDYDESMPYEWNIEIVDSTNEEPVAYIDFAEEWQDMWGIELQLMGISGEVGSVTYRVTFMLAGREFARDYTISVEELPEDIPGDDVLTVETDRRVEVGERFEFSMADITVDESLIPEGMEYLPEMYWIDDWYPATLPNFEWLGEDGSDGFAVTFDSEGRAYFRVGVRFAVNYTIERNVYITAGDGVDGEVGLWHTDNRMPVAYTASDYSWYGSWLLTNYTPMETEDIEWQLECLTEGVEEPSLIISDDWNSGIGVWAREQLTQTGEESYRLTVKVSDEIVLTDEFSVTVQERPDTLPERLSGIENEIWLNVDDTYELLYDSYGFEGDVPEDAVIRKSMAGLDWGLEWTDGFDWILSEDDVVQGIRFKPTHEGRYVFFAEAFINNVYYCEQIYITVGDGVQDDDAVLYHDDGALLDLYAGTESSDRWVANWWLPDIQMYEGDEINWTLERITETDAEPLVEMNLDGQWDDGRGIGVFYDLPDESALTGSEVYRITAHIGNMSISDEFTVNVLPLPEGLPTAVDGVDTEVYIGVGEEFVFTDASWAFADGTVPEDAVVSVRYGEMFTGWDSQLDWIDTEEEHGFVFVPFMDGEYYFDVQFMINNYAVTHRINVIAGEGKQLQADNDKTMVYVDGACEDEWIWLNNVYLGPCAYDPEAEAEWKIELVESTNETPVATVQLADFWGDSWGAELYITGMSGEEGTDKYAVTLKLNEVEYVREYTVTTVAMPEGLPTDEDVVAPQTEYQLEPGEYFELNFDQFSVNNLPENAELRWYIDGLTDPWPLEELPGFEWTENGFIVPVQEGRYAFRVYCDLALNYSVGVDITIQAGEVSMDNAWIDSYQIADTLYYDQGDAYIGHWQIEDCEILPTDQVEWVAERVEAEFQTEEPIVAVSLQVWDNGRGVDITAINPNYQVDGSEYTGGERYTLRCIVNGVEIASTEFALTVETWYEELPEYMPTELSVEQTEYQLDVGSEFVFTTDRFDLAEGQSAPEGVMTVKELWVSEEMQEQGGFEWIEDGFRITAESDCTFVFSAVFRIGNYIIEQPIRVIYGSGLSENFGVDWTDATFTMYRDHGDAWITDAGIHDYTALSEEGIQWTVEPVGEVEYMPIELYVADVWNDGMSAGFHARQNGDENGEIQWLIRATDGESVLVERTVTLSLCDLPEGMPTNENVWLDAEEYQLQPGEKFVFTGDMFGLDEAANVPEGMNAYKEFHSIECIEQHSNGSFEWIENGFSVSFDGDGRHNFRAVIVIGNYHVERTVTLTVGSGISENFGVDWNDVAFEMYKDQGDMWVTTATIHDYAPPAGCEIVWNCYAKDDPEFVPVGLRVQNVWDDGRTGEFHAWQQSGDNGEVTWVLEAVAGDEVIVSREIVLSLTDLPKGLPESLDVEQTLYEVEIGDKLTFNSDMFAVSDSDWSDGFRKEVWSGNLESQEFRWTEDGGFEVTFRNEGRYQFTAAACCNNYWITRDIFVIVGSGVQENAWLHIDQADENVYLGDGIADESQLIYASLQDYVILEGETFEWSLTCSTADDGEALQLELRPYENWVEAEVVVTDVSECGSESYTLTLSSNMGYTANYNFTINVVELPEDLPTQLDIDSEIYLNVGDVYEYIDQDFGFADGTIPEDAHLRAWYEANEDTRGMGPFEWTDEGFIIRTECEGRYGFRVVRMLNNYRVDQYVTLIVGDGLKEDNVVEIRQDVYEIYADGEDVPVGSVYVNDWNYDRMEGEEFIWTLELIDSSENVPVELYISDEWEDNWGIELHSANLTGETGHVTYRVKVQTGMIEQSCDITLVVNERPDDLPSGIVLETNEYHAEIGDTLHIDWRDGYEVTDDGMIPDGAHIRDVYHVSEETFGGEAFAWDEDGMGFSVTFSKDGRYVFDAAKYINNVCLSEPVVVYVGTGVPEDAQMVIDQRFHTTFNSVEETAHFIAEADIENYRLFGDETIEWSIELVEPAEAPAAQLMLDGCEGTRAEVLIGDFTGATGSVTYRLTALAANDLRFEQDITVEIIALPDGLPTEMTGVQNDVQLDVGQEYTFDMSRIGYEGGEMPEGIEYYLEYFADMYPLERLDSFRWNDDGGFSVTFERDANYEFRVAYRIGLNYYLWQDVTITVGEGASQEVSMHGNELSNVMIVEAGVENKAKLLEIFLWNYDPFEGEQVEWSVERLDGGDNPPVELYISEIRDNQTCAALTAEIMTGETGTVNFRVHVITESGYQDFYDFAVEAINEPEDLPTELGLPQSYQLNLNETFTFNAAEAVTPNGTMPEGVMYHYFIEADEALSNAEGFETHYNGTNGMDDSLTFTPTADGRYNIRVMLWIGNYVCAQDVTLIAGDGIADDVAVVWEQYVETAYLGLDSGYLLGFGVLENYNVMPGEQIVWECARLEDSQTGVAEIYLNTFDTEAEVRYSDISETGTVTFRVTVTTDSGFTDSHDYTLTIKELPEDMPTGFSIDIPLEYAVGDTMTFGADNLIFEGGNVPDDGNLRAVVPALTDYPIWYENEAEWTDDGCSITFTHDDRYEFYVTVMLGNYLLDGSFIITVGSGVSGDVGLHCDHAYEEVFLGYGDDGWVGNAYLAEYVLAEDEQVQWRIEFVDSSHDEPLVGLYINNDWDNGLGINLHACDMTQDETGWTIWRVTAEVAGRTFSEDFVIHVNSAEELNIPGNDAVELDETDIALEIDESYEFKYTDIGFDESLTPEGRPANPEIWVSPEIDPYVEWTDEGIIVCFDCEGRFSFDAAVRFNANCAISREVRITVGDGIPDDCSVEVDQFADRFFLDQGDGWIGDAYLQGYTKFSSEEIIWTAEPKDPDAEHSVELTIETADESGYAASIWATQCGEAEGSETFIVTCTTGSGLVLTQEFTIDVVALPEDMPKNLTPTTQSYEAAAGETIQIDLGYELDGTIPEGMADRIVIGQILEALAEAGNGVDWNEEGLFVTLAEEGGCSFRMQWKCGNYTLESGDITISVNGGEAEG